MMEVLRTPYKKDIPNAFKLFDARGKEVLVGSYAKVIENFAVFMKYDLELVEVGDFKMSDIQRNIEKGNFNVSMLSDTYSSFADVDYSYPLEWSNTCVMVPAEDELPRYWYIAWPFGRYIWTFLGVCVIYVACVMTYMKHPSRTFSTNLLYSLSVVMFNSNANFSITNISLRLQLFYTLIMIMGFILSGYYCSYLTMYNMRPVFQPFIRTIDDALEANIKILVSNDIYEILTNNQYINLTRIKRLMTVSSPWDVSERIKKIDRSFAYVVPRTQWIFMSKLQKNLIQPVFKLSDICFGNVFNTYPIQSHAKYAESLTIFIMLIQQSGLWLQWEDEGFIFALKYENYILLEDTYPVDPLNLYYYRIAWIVFIGGLTLSSICFIIEILAFKHKWSLNRLKGKCRNEIKV